MRNILRIVLLCAIFFAAAGGIMAGASPAMASQQFQIAFTGGVGVYPRSGPDMASERVGAALPEGSTITVECELEGTPVSNGAATITVWMKLDNGTYIPNAYVSTGHDSFTPGMPRCESSTDSEEVPVSVPGDYIAYVRSDKPMFEQLIDYYYTGEGKDVVIHWDFFKDKEAFVSWAKTIPVGEEWAYTANPSRDGFDMTTALRTFEVTKTSPHCFKIEDRYDFDIEEGEDLIYLTLKIDEMTGAAASFNVYASGCFFED